MVPHTILPFEYLLNYVFQLYCVRQGQGQDLLSASLEPIINGNNRC